MVQKAIHAMVSLNQQECHRAATNNISHMQALISQQLTQVPNTGVSNQFLLTQELFKTLSGESPGPLGQVLPNIGSLKLEKAKLQARCQQLEAVMQMIGRAQDSDGLDTQQAACTIAQELPQLGGNLPISIALARGQNLQVTFLILSMALSVVPC